MGLKALPDDEGNDQVPVDADARTLEGAGLIG